MTTETTTTTTTEDATKTRTPIVLTAEQEINALRSVHQFFGNFDRVPGFLSSQWSQALDSIAVVANSLIAKANPEAFLTPGDETTTNTTEETVVESAEVKIPN